MHPAVDEPAAVGALGLRDLVLVVGELQVLPAAVDVERASAQGACSSPSTRCASPGRPSPHGRLPRRLVAGWLPSRARSRADPASPGRLRRARRRAARRATCPRACRSRETPAPSSSRRRSRRGTRARSTRASPIMREHLRDVLGRARLVVGLLHAERRGVLVHVADEPRRELADRLAILGRAADDLVVDVRDVADIGDLRSRSRAASAEPRRTPPTPARGRCGSSRRRSSRRRTCARDPARSGRRPPSSGVSVL